MDGYHVRVGVEMPTFDLFNETLHVKTVVSSANSELMGLFIIIDCSLAEDKKRLAPRIGKKVTTPSSKY